MNKTNRQLATELNEIAAWYFWDNNFTTIDSEERKKIQRGLCTIKQASVVLGKPHPTETALRACIQFIEDGGDTADFFKCRELWRKALLNN